VTESDVAVEVEGLRKSFGSNLVLDGVDLSVERGRLFALLGPNGAGKTTVVNILTTLVSPDSGKVRVGGFDVTRQAARVRESISLTGQFAAVDHLLTGRENIVLIAELRHVRSPAATAEALLEQFGLAGAADRRTATYSGGMRRKLDIALGLVGDPAVVFFDEPTTGLDPESRNMMWDTIKLMAAGGKTIFLTTQYLEEADRLADEIAILSHGRVAARGTPQALKSMLPHGQVEIRFAGTGNLERAAGVLADSDPVRDDSTLTLTVTTDGTVARLSRLFAVLEASQLEVAGLVQRTPTLDEAFLQVVGHHGGRQDAPVA
jgi:ABC-2 type transport system ATP-binding protein